MKRILVIIVVAISMLLVSCSTADSGTVSTTSEKPAQTMAVTESTTEETEAATEATEIGQLGDYIVKYVKHEIVEDYEGNPALVVYTTFKNNSEEAANYMFSVMPKAFQNGVELESAMVIDEIKEYSNSTKDIKPGVELDVCSIFKLDDKTSDVEFEVSELISFDETKIVELLKLS